MILVIMRHGQTQYNANRWVQGQINIPLNDFGRKQARDAANMIIEKKETFDVIASSPLSRALESAYIISKKLKMKNPIYVDHAFIERDFNQLDGVSLDIALPLVRSKNYTHDGYEIDEMLIERVKNAAFRLAHKMGDRSVLMVSHSHVIKSLLISCDPVQFSFADTIVNNGELIYFEIKNHTIKLLKK
ncbi:MAG: histidine phosphatase family protein [Acholeplasmataceae bacterium]|nr:histidine phosphatase family protein [Acholeplasmataceae bacterium]